MPQNSCHSCEGQLEILKNFEGFPLISSDSRPQESPCYLARCRECSLVQKSIDELWTIKVEKIYGEYDMSSSHPGPRMVFQSGRRAMKRVDEISQRLFTFMSARNSIRCLDVGTGNGDLLWSLKQKFQDMRMDVLETSSHQRESILKIPGVENFFVDIDQIEGKYDLITLSHVLEHIVDPVDYLVNLGKVLRGDGIIAIQVPNYSVSKLDLVVLDHASHFDQGTLEGVIHRAGFSVASNKLTNGSREISCLIHRSTTPPKRVHLPQQISIVNESISSIFDFSEKVKRVDSTDHLVFGAGNGGAWVYALTRGKVVAFVDDDPQRDSTIFMGKPVVNRRRIREMSVLTIPIFGDRAREILAELTVQPAYSVIPQ